MIDYDIFKTLVMVKIASLGKELVSDGYGYISNKTNHVILYRTNDYKEYYDSGIKITFRNIKEKDLVSLGLDNIKIILKTYSPIYYLENDFFELNGPKRKKLRNDISIVNRKYSNLVIQDYYNNIEDIFSLYSRWRENKGEKVLLDEIKFIKNHGIDSFKKMFIYENDILISYAIAEKINDSCYNLLFQTSDKRYQGISNYVLFNLFRNLFLKTKEKGIYINSGGCGVLNEFGKKLFYFKTNYFDVYDENIIYNCSLI